MFVRYVNKKIHSIEESQIVFQFNTSLNHLKKKFELSSIYKCLIQKSSELFVLNLDVVGCHVHIFVVCFTNIVNSYHNKKKSPTFFSRGSEKKQEGLRPSTLVTELNLFGLMLRRLGIEPSLILAYETSGMPYPPPAIINSKIHGRIPNDD